MQRNRFKEKLMNRLKEKFEYGGESGITELLNNIKLIDNFGFAVELYDVTDEIKDDVIVVNIERAFDNKELQEFDSLSSQFKNKLKELNFIISAYLNQQKYASEKFDLPLTIKIKKSLDDVLKKLDGEKRVISTINGEIDSKERKFAEKMLDFSKILNDMRNDDSVDEEKLIAMFGDEFINGYRMKLIGAILDKNLSKVNIEELVNNAEFNKLMEKYSIIKTKLDEYVGANC